MGREGGEGMSDPDVKTTHLSMIAAERNRINGWEAYSWKMCDDTVIVDGAVPRIVSKGPSKGSRRWPGRAHPTHRTHAITLSYAVEWVLRRETATGVCSTCDGAGCEVAGWADGRPLVHRDCRRCGGSGKAPPAVTR